MEVSYNVIIKEELSGRRLLSEECLKVADFIRKKEEKLVLEYITREEAKRHGNTVREFLRRNQIATVCVRVSEKSIHVLRCGGMQNDT